MTLVELEKIHILNNFLTSFHTNSVREEYLGSQHNNIKINNYIDLFLSVKGKYILIAVYLSVLLL